MNTENGVVGGDRIPARSPVNTYR